MSLQFLDEFWVQVAKFLEQHGQSFDAEVGPKDPLFLAKRGARSPKAGLAELVPALVEMVEEEPNFSSVFFPRFLLDRFKTTWWFHSFHLPKNQNKLTMAG